LEKPENIKRKFVMMKRDDKCNIKLNNIININVMHYILLIS